MRNVSPIKINEFRVGTGSPANSTNSFIELYNAGTSEVDITNWTLTEHPAQQAAGHLDRRVVRLLSCTWIAGALTRRR